MSKESTFESVVSKLSTNQKKFIVEVIGTFIVVVLATGSVVINAKFNGVLGLPFIAFAPFVGVAIGVYLFGKISMAHFNPAVSVGFLITKHITRELIALYLLAEIVGALLASLFVSIVIGKEANLEANAPNYSYPLPLIFGIEVLASALLMAVILTVVYKRFERIWRCRYRSYCWIRYFVFGFYIWSVNESCSFISSSIIIGSMD
jgi:glycerol uptake facilitator-like aquaporin